MISKKHLLLVLVLFFLPFNAQQKSIERQIKNLQSIYKKVNKDLKKTHHINKLEGIPPNEYNEQDYRNTLNPETGTPEFYKLINIKKDIDEGKYLPQTKLSLLSNSNNTDKTLVGQPWIERGPYSVGGRTRAIMFDPNDATGKRVFAGGVSGGLWVNQDITSSTSEWKPINDFWANTSISCITYDPNNPQIFYVGTGECETGDAIGSGIWKSTNGGATWVQIFTVPVSYNGTTRRGNFYINDIKIRNNAGTSEIYAGVSGALVGIANGQINDGWNGLYEAGLYKSTNGGTTFTKNTNLLAYDTSAATTSTIGYSIQQIEIGIDNSVWVSTRSSRFSNIDSGGRIFKSTDGNNFTQVYDVGRTTARVNFCLSKTNANKAYALMQGASSSTEPVRIARTTDGGTTWVATNDAFPIISLPTDADTGIPTNDFTRGQSFYDLIIIADPSNDDTVYIGGIDIFRSIDGATTWSQISKWSNNNNLASLSVSSVHADQHNIIFNPKNINQMLFSNDGGIFYTSNKSNIVSTTGISARNTRYNVTQFYGAVLNPIKTSASEEFLAGAQDNGTQRLSGAPQTNNFYTSSIFSTGDGMYPEYDDLGTYKISSYVYNNHYCQAPNSSTYSLLNSNLNNGHFVNEIALDRKLDIFYSNNLTSGATSGLSINRVFGLASNGVYTRSTISAGTAGTNEQISCMKVSPHTTTSTTLFVGSNLGKIYKMTTANATPTTTTLTTPAVGNISDIEFGSNESNILVTLSNYGASIVNIHYSTDGGTTWQNKEGNLPDMPVRSIFMNPDNNNEVIVGTELGIWGTTNFLAATPTWAQYSNGIGNVRVTSIDYRASNKTLLVSTYGRGAYTSSNSVLGIQEVTPDRHTVTIYPNPSKGEFNLKFDQNKFKNVSITIFDKSGRKVFSKNNVIQDNLITTNLKTGNYIVKVDSDNNMIATSNVIIIGKERD